MVGLVWGLLVEVDVTTGRSAIEHVYLILIWVVVTIGGANVVLTRMREVVVVPLL